MRRTSSSRSAAAPSAGIGLVARRSHTPPPEVPAGKVNLTDPDSKRLKAREGYVQGYNAQAVVDEGQIVLAAEITNSNVDWSQLDPMVTATIAELERAGIAGRPETALADAQYWNEEHMDEVIANKHIQVLIPPDGSGSGKQRAGWTGGRYTMDAITCSPQHSASSCTENACRRSSRCSVTPATTEVSHDSSEEAGPPCAPSGDY